MVQLNRQKKIIKCELLNNGVTYAAEPVCPDAERPMEPEPS